MFAPDADPRRHRLLTGTRDLTHRRSYYLAQFQRQGGGSGLALFWPDQHDVGVHGNIIQQYAPEMEKRLCWQWRRPRSASWRIDETSIKVRGQWAYLSRALDKFGSTIDFYLSATRNTKAAKRFLGKALRGWQDWERPVVLNTDKAPTYAGAIAELKAEGKCPDETRHRQVKYLNNVPGRDHGKLNASRGVSALPAEPAARPSRPPAAPRRAGPARHRHRAGGVLERSRAPRRRPDQTPLSRQGRAAYRLNRAPAPRR